MLGRRLRILLRLGLIPIILVLALIGVLTIRELPLRLIIALIGELPLRLIIALIIIGRPIRELAGNLVWIAATIWILGSHSRSAKRKGGQKEQTGL